MKRWGSVLIILLLIHSNQSGATSVNDSEVWKHGEEFFDLKTVMEKGKIRDILIVKKYSLRQLSKSKYRFEREVLKIKDFLRDFNTEVYRSPAKVKFQELTLERNKLLLAERTTTDRFERKKINTTLSSIATYQGNLLSEIESWKIKLATVFKIIVRLNPEGNALSRIEFLHPNRSFFDLNRPGTTILVKNTYN